MADISKLNGYDIKDKVARETINSLNMNFESINNNLNDINSDIEELNGIIGNISTVGPFPLIVSSANAFNFGSGTIELSTQEQQDLIDIIMQAKSLALHNVIVNVIVTNYNKSQLLSLNISGVNLEKSWGTFAISQFINSTDEYFDYSARKATFIQVRYDTENNRIISLRTQGQFFVKSFLSTTNNSEYTPTGDYNPATKKYVDDSIKNKEDLTNSLVAGDSGSKGGLTLTRNGKVYQLRGNIDVTPTELGVVVKIPDGMGPKSTTSTEDVSFTNAIDSTGEIYPLKVSHYASGEFRLEFIKTYESATQINLLVDYVYIGE